MKQICLKDWQLAYCDIGAWQPEDAAAQPTIPCAVPGAVHLALLQAGIIDEPLGALPLRRGQGLLAHGHVHARPGFPRRARPADL